LTPRATCRLQFHKDFTFADAEAIVPYLAELGVSHLYASPIAAARKGSVHGYDVIDPTRINPELGGEDALRRLVAALKRQGMGLIIDIVPNHMAASPENGWWMDVLTHGRASRYARSFDIDWEPDDKVFLPWLTSPVAEAKAAGEIDKLQLPKPGAYRLGWWRTANDRINWRRFFDINDLVCLRMEDDETFERVHALTFRLLAEGLIDGVRIDHVDGLADPASYCRKLRQRIGAAYFVVEKILLAGETLSPTWQCEGTTGYNFMDEVNAVQHDPAAAAPLGAAWTAVSRRPSDFAVEEEAARREILARSFGAQLDACIATFVRHAPTEDLSEPAIRRALTELLAHFPVYRTYASADERPAADEAFLSIALEGAKRTALSSDHWVLDLLAHWFRDPGLSADPLRRFQQLSAPIAAKSVEDTGFYRYGRLLSRNDVGFDPHRFASTPADFHRMMLARLQTGPNAMLATATHDHKRGEDVRARLAVLSEQPDLWIRHLKDWISRSPDALDPADLAMLFQSVVGAWPLDLALDDKAGRTDFARRLIGWQEKALREAKLRSNWSDPNQDYEAAARNFIQQLIAEDCQLALLTDVFSFIQEIAAAGAVNGLAQVALKLTVPGMPDIYQGTEFWDFSLVDPDNRRPVDFDARRKSLGALSASDASASWRNGRIKQLLAHRLLGLRRAKPELFALGSYEPLDAGDHIIAFRRCLGSDSVSVAVPRLPSRSIVDSAQLALIKGDAFRLSPGPELFEDRLPLSIFSTFAARFYV
jgi:(1->4)-alpha-D-glucan 1-alpha-D-glucosylmutase